MKLPEDKHFFGTKFVFLFLLYILSHLLAGVFTTSFASAAHFYPNMVFPTIY